MCRPYDTARSWTGGSWTRPYGIRRTCTVCSAKPGAPTGPHQFQFLQTQGPVARREFRPATQILRAGNFLPSPRGNPRKWGSGGKPTWRTKFAPAASPGDSLVTFSSLRKSLAARRRRPPCVQRIQSEPCPLIRPSVRTGAPSPPGGRLWWGIVSSSVTASPCHLSLSPLSLRDISP